MLDVRPRSSAISLRIAFVTSTAPPRRATPRRRWRPHLNLPRRAARATARPEARQAARAVPLSHESRQIELGPPMARGAPRGEPVPVLEQSAQCVERAASARDSDESSGAKFVVGHAASIARGWADGQSRICRQVVETRTWPLLADARRPKQRGLSHHRSCHSWTVRRSSNCTCPPFGPS